MKEKTFLILRKLSHVTLFIVSLSFTLFLFIQFGEQIHEKIIWGILGFALEVIKLYLFMLAKANLKEKDWHAKVGAVAQFVVYLGIAFISMIATLGFALMTIEGQSFAAQVSQNIFEIEAMHAERDELTLEIATFQQQQADLPEGWITASQRISESISTLRERRDFLNTRIVELQRERVQAQTVDTSNVFVLIGSVVDLDGRTTLYYLMLVMVVALEVCLVITSGHIERALRVDSSTRIYEYIHSLFDVNGVRLKTDHDIHKETGISLAECFKYRQVLQNVTYKGTPMISQRRGGTKANFAKDNIIKIVKFHYNTQK